MKNYLLLPLSSCFFQPRPTDNPSKQQLTQNPGWQKLVTINAPNEWVEESYLEPDTSFKYAYVEAVKEVFK